MKKPNPTLFLIMLTVLIILPAQLHAAEITLTNYYPALTGEYDRLQLAPRSNLSDPCLIGTLYVGNSTNSLQYCPNGQWEPITDVWTHNGDDIYLTDTTLHVGIGTKTPEFKLSIQNDAGIISKGTFGMGLSFPDNISAGSHLIWYPRKAAFRAGYCSFNMRPDFFIGNYSVALGKDVLATGAYSTVGGGETNTLSGAYSNVIGGKQNTANGDYSAIIGGSSNTTAGQYTIISGGQSNSASANYTTVLGGQSNQANAIYATNSGGFDNQIQTPYSNINGGQGHRINITTGLAGYSVIGGGLNNQITADYGIISGGENNIISNSYASIGGGFDNTAGTGGSPSYARVSGGQANLATAPYSTISGGQQNQATGTFATIGGGKQNIATQSTTAIGGGERNTASGLSSAIIGGTDNTAAGDYSWANGKNMQLSAAAARTFVWGYSDTPVPITAPDAFIIASGTIAGNPWNPKVGIRDIDPRGILEINANGTADDYITIKKENDVIFLVKKNINNATYIGINRPTPSDASYVMQVGTNATNGNGAYLRGNGQWSIPSSREFKENIRPLTSQQAQDTLDQLQPVTFNYKINTHPTAGFIAEDVPDVVAMKDRKSLSSMDIIALLTKVSQDQEQAIQEQKEKIIKIRNEILRLKEMIGN